MATRPLGSDTITLRVPTETVDTVDNTTYFTYADGAEIKNCNVQAFLMTQKFQEEFTIERESTRTFFRVFAPWTDETALITDKYRLLFRGVEYEVHALIGKWQHFSGKHNHVGFLIKLRIG